MRLTRLSFILAIAVASIVNGNAQTPPDVGLGQATAADTLRYSVPAGEALIVNLPPRHRGNEASYRLLKAPALSWLVDRSFFWRTTAGERGRLPILVERRSGSSRDTLVLLVQIQG